jgi:cobalt-zinc-cadmium efflux system membrane fusion protein
MKNSYIVFLLPCFILLACTDKKPSANTTAEAVSDGKLVTLDSGQVASTNIVVGKAIEKNISTTFKVNGTIDVPPQNMVSVSMPLGGYLKNTKLLPGMHINKGEVIAQMEDPKYIELQQDFLVARARLELLQKEYERQQELHVSKAASDKVYQQSKEAYETAHINYRSLFEKLKLIGVNPDKLTEKNISGTIPIYAPISGFVSKINVNIGKYVNPSDVLFELVNPEDIHLSLNIFEKDMENVFMGQKVVAYTNNHPERKYDCEVILIGKDVGSDRSINIHCHFEKYDKLLVPGTYMNAEISSLPKKGFVMPESAVMSEGKTHYVFVKKQSNSYEAIEVSIGITQGNEVEVIPLNGFDLVQTEVVLEGAYSLWMKMKNIEEE